MFSIEDYKKKYDLTDEFRKNYIVPLKKGGEAIKVEGFTYVAHERGLKSVETEILQMPNQANNNVCICKTTVVGYAWDPITEKIEEVVFSDIGDASPANCNAMVAGAFIRMASTRSYARAMRRYTGIDKVCSSELDDSSNTGSYTANTSHPHNTFINQVKYTQITTLLAAKHIPQPQLDAILGEKFHCNYNSMNQLTMEQADILISILQKLPMPQQAPQQMPSQTTVHPQQISQPSTVPSQAVMQPSASNPNIPASTIPTEQEQPF